MPDFTLTPAGPFSLAASTRFLEGFAPAAYQGHTAGHLDLAFPVDGDWRTVGVHLQQDARSGAVAGEVAGEADPELVRAQVAPILSLDGFPGLSDRKVEWLRTIAEGWRPYRTWVCLLLRTELEDDTHEIANQARRASARAPRSHE
jgi:DNA-3-methyladenine glycosylase II